MMFPFGEGNGGEVIWLGITAEPGCGETDMAGGVVAVVDVNVADVDVDVVADVVVGCRGR